MIPVEPGSDSAAGERDQLDALVAVFESWERAGIRSWLSGGWAVDFQLGRITLAHSDIDFVIGAADWLVAERHLIAAGFSAREPNAGQGVISFTRNEVRVEIVLITESVNGLTTPGYEHRPWPKGSFDDCWRGLLGHRVRVASAESIIDIKTNWEAAQGEPPRPHDLADLKELAALIEACDDGDPSTEGSSTHNSSASPSARTVVAVASALLLTSVVLAVASESVAVGDATTHAREHATVSAVIAVIIAFVGLTIRPSVRAQSCESGARC